MADLLQKVFLVFVRPYYNDSQGRKVFHQGQIYTKEQSSERTLTTNNTGSPANSPVKINGSGKYASDPWFLHSSYASYNQFREELKNIIAVYGTDNVKCAVYVPIDYEVLPRE